MHIPQTVAFVLAEQLTDDKLALKQCSRVCRSLLAPCRRRLFGTLVIRDPPEGHSKPKGRFVMFLQLLQRSDMIGLTLGIYIQSLLLEGSDEARPLLDASLAAGLLSMLPNLLQLDLFCVRLRGHPSDSEVIPTMSPVLRCMLDKLSMVAVGSKEDRMHDLYHFLSLFTHIGRFIIDGNHYPCPSKKEKGLYPWNLTVQHLIVTSGGTSLFPPTKVYLDMLRFTDCIYSLTTIEAGCATSSDIRALGELITQCARRLVQITLCISDDFGFEPGTSF